MRLEHAGGAKVTTSVGEMSDTAMTVDAADLTNWPTGTVGPFYGCMNKGKLTEEKILFSGRSGNTLQVWTGTSGNGRGADGTVAQTHPANSSIEHIWTADEADDANAHIESADGAHGYPPKATLVTTDGDQTVSGDKTFTGASAFTGVASFVRADIETVDINHGDIGVERAQVLGAQTEAEFRVRNTYIGVGDPADSLGNDGDIYIQKG